MPDSRASSSFVFCSRTATTFQPWRLPPLGANPAWSRIFTSTSSGSGSLVKSRAENVVRITSYSSMACLSSEAAAARGHDARPGAVELDRGRRGRPVVDRAGADDRAGAEVDVVRERAVRDVVAQAADGRARAEAEVVRDVDGPAAGAEVDQGAGDLDARVRLHEHQRPVVDVERRAAREQDRVRSEEHTS